MCEESLLCLLVRVMRKALNKATLIQDNLKCSEGSERVGVHALSREKDIGYSPTWQNLEAESTKGRVLANGSIQCKSKYSCFGVPSSADTVGH